MFPHAVGLSCISRLSDRRFLGRIHNPRQPDREGRSAARLALNCYVTVHHPTGALADREAETRAAISARRLEEAWENS